MFKKHAIQMKVVKDIPETVVLPDPNKYDKIADTALKIGAEGIKGAATLITTYVAADTVRRCVMHIVATKIN